MRQQNLEVLSAGLKVPSMLFWRPHFLAPNSKDEKVFAAVVSQSHYSSSRAQATCTDLARSSCSLVSRRSQDAGEAEIKLRDDV